MMLRATPNTNPFSTGLEMKSEMKPSFRMPASRNRPPRTSVTAEASTMNLPGSAAASGATVAARIADEAEVGETTNWRLDPKIAYASSPKTVA